MSRMDTETAFIDQDGNAVTYEQVFTKLGFGPPGSRVDRHVVSECFHLLGIDTDLPIGTTVKTTTLMDGTVIRETTPPRVCVECGRLDGEHDAACMAIE